MFNQDRLTWTDQQWAKHLGCPMCRVPELRKMVNKTFTVQIVHNKTFYTVQVINRRTKKTFITLPKVFYHYDIAQRALPILIVNMPTPPALAMHQTPDIPKDILQLLNPRTR